MEPLIIEYGHPRQTLQFTIDAEGRDLSRNHMQVRCAMFDHHAKEFIDLRHRSQPPSKRQIVVYEFLVYGQMKL